MNRTPVWIGLGIGLIAGAITLYVALRADGTELTRADWDAARARWRNASIRGYIIEIETRGLRPALHRVVVAQGKVVERTTDGELAPARVHGTWSVDGMFDTLDMELRNRANPKIPYGVDSADQVVTRVVFDKKYGFPRSYLRHVLGRTGSIEWVVKSFEPRGR